VAPVVFARIQFAHFAPNLPCSKAGVTLFRASLQQADRRNVPIITRKKFKAPAIPAPLLAARRRPGFPAVRLSTFPN
jgi:hypothetical protein